MNVSNFLARSSSGDSLALVRLLATSDTVASPGPVLAAGAENVNVGSARLDSANDLVDGDISDGNTSTGSTLGRAVVIILLNDDAVLGNVLEGDRVILDIGNRACRSINSLDADTVVRVGNDRVEDADSLDNIVRAATNGADRQAVATAAVSSSEGNVGARVDGEAVVLVLDNSTRDVNTGG